jgi:hypothetical protein
MSTSGFAATTRIANRPEHPMFRTYGTGNKTHSDGPVTGDNNYKIVKYVKCTAVIRVDRSARPHATGNQEVECASTPHAYAIRQDTNTRDSRAYTVRLEHGSGPAHTEWSQARRRAWLHGERSDQCAIARGAFGSITGRPGRSSAPQMTAPTAKMAALHQNAVV